ncbi:hypothetical protein AAVH_15455, partial [Aphelenchoides avenae]
MSVNPALGSPDPVAQRGLRKTMCHESVHESKVRDKCYTPPPRDHKKDFCQRLRLLETKTMSTLPLHADKGICKI